MSSFRRASTIESFRSERPSKKASARTLVPALVKNPSTVEDLGLHRTGRFAGGICADLRRRLPWYCDDWVEGWRGGRKTLIASVFMFFACLAPIIAFGAEVSSKTKGELGVVEFLISQGVGGVVWAIIGGSPLVILQPTGPITLFVSQLFLLAQGLNISFLALQAWTGIFCGAYMILLAVSDNCALSSLITHFTEDVFGFFISIVFICMGLENIADKFQEPDGYSSTAQVLLTVATLYVALKLASCENTSFFNETIRGLISDMAVPLSVIIFALIGSFLQGPLDAPLKPLPVPAQFQPTQADRAWLVAGLGDTKCMWVGAIAALPLLFLNFVDQNVTTLLTHHPDHKLKKGGAFHYNLMVLGVMTAVLPLFGCPVVVGALPHSPQFAGALAQTEIVRENGMQTKKIIKVFENRVSPLIVGSFIVASLAVVGSMSSLPYCIICDALFLFMGVTGLPGNQLFERMKLAVTETALYPPLPFSQDDVPLLQMHLFTAVQFAAVAVLFIVEKSVIALAFPIFLILLIPLRESLSTITCGVISQKVVDILDHKDDAPSDAPSQQDALQKSKVWGSMATSHMTSGHNAECLLEEGNTSIISVTDQ